MKSVNILILVVSFLFITNVSAQSFDLKKYNKEKEKIINVVINSVQFDSIYSSKRVYFSSNELLGASSPLVLKKGNCKVKILEPMNLKQQQKEYVSIGDFTMPKENPMAVRVQLYSSSTKKLLNVRLIKEDGDWIIENHMIFDD